VSAPPYQINWSVTSPGTYVITAVATDNRKESTRSTPVNITVKGVAGQPPAAPTGLKASAKSRTEINLTWTDKSSNETGFVIEQSRDGQSFTEVAKVPADTKAFTVGNLSGFTRYYFRVRAVNASGASAYSNVANTRTRAL
jgi:titin